MSHPLHGSNKTHLRVAFTTKVKLIRPNEPRVKPHSQSCSWSKLIAPTLILKPPGSAALASAAHRVTFTAHSRNCAIPASSPGVVLRKPDIFSIFPNAVRGRSHCHYEMNHEKTA
eukprot:COSAG06_NODE_21796_length_745_cov_0.722910_1_plen_114_part_10